jgi:P-type Mg2+ transporter
VFDLMTFALLLEVVDASEPVFQTAWFVVSLLTELAVVLVLRTRGPLWKSRPSALLLWSTVIVALTALALPFVPALQSLFGFVALPASLMAALVAIVLAYLLCTEWAKRHIGAA